MLDTWILYRTMVTRTITTIDFGCKLVILKLISNYFSNIKFEIYYLNTAVHLQFTSGVQYNTTVPFLRNFHWGGGGGQNRKKRQNENYEPLRFGERTSLKRDFVKL
jgi:hypothetical protein